jgi:predicted RNA polymerase sigma factor
MKYAILNYANEQDYASGKIHPPAFAAYAQALSEPTEAVKNYQSYWALKAHLLKQLGCKLEAQQAYSRAIGLTEDAAIREILLHQSLSLGE